MEPTTPCMGMLRSSHDWPATRSGSINIYLLGMRLKFFTVEAGGNSTGLGHSCPITKVGIFILNLDGSSLLIQKGAASGLGIRRWVGHGFMLESFLFYIPMSVKIGSTWIGNQVTQKDG